MARTVAATTKAERSAFCWNPLRRFPPRSKSPRRRRGAAGEKRARTGQVKDDHAGRGVNGCDKP